MTPTTNILSEVVSLVVGLITTFVVPWLNKRFGTKLNPDRVGAEATEVLDRLSTRYAISDKDPFSGIPPLGIVEHVDTSPASSTNTTTSTDPGVS